MHHAEHSQLVGHRSTSLTSVARIGARYIAAALVGWISGAAQAADPPVDYDRDIRPILSDRCYRCHGPDSGARQADLRLDTRDGLGQVIVRGQPDASPLVERIESHDESVRMPPTESKLSLSPAEQQLLRRWIAGGAEIHEHWAFRPLPDAVPLPAVGNADWPRRGLDYFVLARLEAAGLEPSPPADARRLVRRVTLDLTGLPPTLDEIRAFESAAAVDLERALDEWVDRLLASPAYGQHMAVGWLDLVRYADSYGYQSDQLNTQWPYRDWVVRAFNNNLPYDQFVTWQLAGDLLDNPTTDQRLATAFNRLHRMTNEGGSLAEEWLVENAADRVHTVGTAMLGLTLECARCHDHKYDPITMRDYYSLMAFFNSIDENGMYDHAEKVPAPSLLLPTPEQAERLDRARADVAAATQEHAQYLTDHTAAFDQWLATAPRAIPSPDLIGKYSFDSPLEQMKNEAPEGTGVAHGEGVTSVTGVRGQAVGFDGDHAVTFPALLAVDRWDAFTVDWWLRDAAPSPLPTVVMQRSFGTDVGYNGFDVMLEGGVLDVRLYRIWPGNAIGIRSLERLPLDQWVHLAVTYDGSSSAQGLRLYCDGQPLPTVVVRDHLTKQASFPAYGDGHFRLGQRFRDRGFRGGAIDELQVFQRALVPLEVENLHDGAALARALTNPIAHREALREFYFSAVDQRARQLTSRVREAWQAMVAAEDAMLEVSIMEDMETPRPTYILARGAYDAPRTENHRVGRDTFSQILIPFPPQAPRNRLGLARWMTDPRHPLTARVMVNRVWAHFFGNGLVATPEYFGQQGAAPTHPELIDWLSRDFVEHGWDVKRLCREIVLSSTYWQDSRSSPERQAIDPENQLLARGPSRRLSAEQIRDVVLAASELLDPRLGGPPVSPYQPGEDLWRETNPMSPPYRQSTGVDLYRRSLYTVWKRTVPPPNMLAFDAPTRESCTAARARTNTPLQALVLLNDVQFVEAARALAALVSRRHRDEADQLREAFLRLAGRQPDDVELSILREIRADQRRRFTDGSQDAEAFLRVGSSPPDSPLAPADLAALVVTCQAIINLDATVFER
jgi:hypothetical protein